MVEYFCAKQLGTAHVFSRFGCGAVYGSRCVKPPIPVSVILYGQSDADRRHQLRAQSLTSKPLKGMPDRAGHHSGKLGPLSLRDGSTPP